MRKHVYGREKLQSTYSRFMDSPTLKVFIHHLQSCRRNEGQGCPHCNSHQVVGHGQYRDRKRYKCKSCKKTFNDFTHTPLHRTHYPKKWMKFLELVLKGSSLYYASLTLKVSYTTVFYWRHKLLQALQSQETVKILSEKIQPYWKYELISFRRHSIPLPGLVQHEQLEFKKWMNYYDWIAVKYMNRYLAWFRSIRLSKRADIQDGMKELLRMACSIPLNQTYQSVQNPNSPK